MRAHKIVTISTATWAFNLLRYGWNNANSFLHFVFGIFYTLSLSSTLKGNSYTRSGYNDSAIELLKHMLLQAPAPTPGPATSPPYLASDATKYTLGMAVLATICTLMNDNSVSVITSGDFHSSSSTVASGCQRFSGRWSKGTQRRWCILAY